ncbi:hypothetical protein L596_011404 [Steinernema carpocapsae]|uniref:Uncharacterized protein n=1 Tax=Steinernema carpocapsae TaxID=34508 RepID=A0A4V6A4G9_STECR|nr:hypothetical protein L596_011404 [Steinernema carpocapsae]
MRHDPHLKQHKQRIGRNPWCNRNSNACIPNVSSGRATSTATKAGETAATDPSGRKSCDLESLASESASLTLWLNGRTIRSDRKPLCKFEIPSLREFREATAFVRVGNVARSCKFWRFAEGGGQKRSEESPR